MFLQELTIYFKINQKEDEVHLFLTNLNFKNEENVFTIQYNSAKFTTRLYQGNIWIMKTQPIQNHFELNDFYKLIHTFIQRAENLDMKITELNIIFLTNQSFPQMQKSLYPLRYRRPYEMVETLTMNDYKNKNELSLIFSKNFNTQWNVYELFINPLEIIHIDTVQNYIQGLQGKL